MFKKLQLILIIGWLILSGFGCEQKGVTGKVVDPSDQGTGGANEIMTYPVPSDRGIYLVVGNNLMPPVPISINKYDGALIEKKSHYIFLEEVGRNIIIESGIIRFIDTSTEPIRFARLNNNGLIEAYTSTDFISRIFNKGIEYKYCGFIEDKTEKIGKEGRVLRTIKASPGVYALVAISPDLKSEENAGNYKKAFQVAVPFQDIKDLAFYLAGTIRNENYRSNAVNHIVTAYAKNGQIEKALESVECDKGFSFSQVHAIAEISKISAEAGQRDRAESIIKDLLKKVEDFKFNEIPQKGDVKTDSSPDANMWRAEIAETFAEIDDIEKALEVAEAINDEKTRWEALAEIAGIIGQKGQIEKALEVSGSIKNPVWEAYALNNITESLSKNNQAEKMIPALSAFMVKIKDIKAEGEKTAAASHLASALTTAGQVNKALEVLQVIGKGSWHYNYTLMNMSTQVKNAVQIDQMLNLIEGDKEDDPQPAWLTSYNEKEVLRILTWKSKDDAQVDRILKIAEAMKDEYSKGDTLAGIASSIAQNGDVDKALKIAGSINNKYDNQDRALMEISGVCASAGKVDQAIKIVESIKQKNMKANVRMEISTALVKAGRLEDAISILSDLLPRVKELSQEFVQEFALFEMPEELVKAGQIDKALEIAGMIRIDDTRKVFLSELAREISFSDMDKTRQKAYINRIMQLMTF